MPFVNACLLNHQNKVISATEINVDHKIERLYNCTCINFIQNLLRSFGNSPSTSYTMVYRCSLPYLKTSRRIDSRSLIMINLSVCFNWGQISGAELILTGALCRLE